MIGMWENNVKEGKGAYYYIDGSVFEGIILTIYEAEFYKATSTTLKNIKLVF